MTRRYTPLSFCVLSPGCAADAHFLDGRSPDASVSGGEQSISVRLVLRGSDGKNSIPGGKSHHCPHATPSPAPAGRGARHHRREALPNERVHKNDTIVPASYSCTRVRARLSAARSLSSSRSHPRATPTGTALSRARQKALRSTPHGALAAGPTRLVCWPRAPVTALTLTGVRAEPTTCPGAPWVQSGGKARFGSQRPCSHEGHGHDPLPRPRPTGPRRLPPFPNVRRGR